MTLPVNPLVKYLLDETKSIWNLFYNNQMSESSLHERVKRMNTQVLMKDEAKAFFEFWANNGTKMFRVVDFHMWIKLKSSYLMRSSLLLRKQTTTVRFK